MWSGHNILERGGGIMTTPSGSGPVERAIRAAVTKGTILQTAGARVRFEVGSLDSSGIVLLFGKKQTRTPISWPCLEGIPVVLGQKGWVRGGGIHDAGAAGPLDAYLKRYIRRNTATYVAA